MIQFSPDVLFQDLEGEAVLLHITTERYYGLDQVGVRFWHLLQTHGAIEPVVQQALTEFEVDEATLRQDLDVFLSEFEAAGLITTG